MIRMYCIHLVMSSQSAGEELEGKESRKDQVGFYLFSKIFRSYSNTLSLTIPFGPSIFKEIIIWIDALIPGLSHINFIRE